jgi:hypothetical protein
VLVQLRLACRNYRAQVWRQGPADCCIDSCTAVFSLDEDAWFPTAGAAASLGWGVLHALLVFVCD